MFGKNDVFQYRWVIIKIPACKREGERDSEW